MAAASRGKQFALEAMDEDNASVGREDGQLVVTRQLSDEVTDLEDILDLATEHGLPVENVTVDVPGGEVRVWVGGGDEA